MRFYFGVLKTVRVCIKYTRKCQKVLNIYEVNKKDEIDIAFERLFL